MKFKKLKAEIKRISNIEDPQETQDAIRALNHKINAPKIKHVKRGNKVFFYEYEYFYDKEKKRTADRTIQSLGGITREKYSRNKQEIEALENSGKTGQLKTYLKKLNIT